MNLKINFFLGIAFLTIFSRAGSAQAAALEGRVEIAPPTDAGGVPTGVIFTGTGISDPNGNPLPNFDFVPPSGGGDGDVVVIEPNPSPTGENEENDFRPFVGSIGTIRDLTLAEILAIGGRDNLDDFILIDDAFSVTLTTFSFPEYSFVNGGTTVSIGLSANFINISDDSNDVSTGTGTFSIDFAGLTIAETQALFDEPGETTDQFNPSKTTAFKKEYSK